MMYSPWSEMLTRTRILGLGLLDRPNLVSSRSQRDENTTRSLPVLQSLKCRRGTRKSHGLTTEVNSPPDDLARTPIAANA